MCINFVTLYKKNTKIAVTYGDDEHENEGKYILMQNQNRT